LEVYKVFSEFRDLMDRWDSARRMMLENDLCLFFKKDGRFYGATESGRITFARMKNPETEEDKAWRKEATFTAYDLADTADGEEKTSVFGAADLPDIKTVSEDEARKSLKKSGKDMPSISDDEGEEKPYGEE
jgi:hypothetical protein